MGAEAKISNVDDCKIKCATENKSGSGWKGYWWKGWGGGYCGCCKQTDEIDTSWPDATTYYLDDVDFDM